MRKHVCAKNIEVKAAKKIHCFTWSVQKMKFIVIDIPRGMKLNLKMCVRIKKSHSQRFAKWFE
ncbi:hypothetical protein BpHYR1_022687 [Brachionus plicatilis]|uniref:Uncharacterized protein n=1 Tax=Brachionus plicatilis TaxID=10195 RepID=A0A3M7SJQ0_BRAPC|nr:hypothetical protein BpHYR1_022687 [Brachionus plicatilis]